MDNILQMLTSELICSYAEQKEQKEQKEQNVRLIKSVICTTPKKWFIFCFAIGDTDLLKGVYTVEDYDEANSRTIIEMSEQMSGELHGDSHYLMSRYRNEMVNHLYTLTVAHGSSIRTAYDAWVVKNPQKKLQVNQWNAGKIPMVATQSGANRIHGADVVFDELSNTFHIKQSITMTDLTCVVCMECVVRISTRSMIVCDNGHRTCQNCMRQSEKMQCPICRSLIMVLDQVTTNIVVAHFDMCPNEGCGTTGLPKMIEEHIIECSHAPMLCKWCNIQIDPTKYIDHIMNDACRNTSYIRPDAPYVNLNFVLMMFSQDRDRARLKRVEACNDNANSTSCRINTSKVLVVPEVDSDGDPIPELEGPTVNDNSDDNSDDGNDEDEYKCSHSMSDLTPVQVRDTIAPVVIMYSISSTQLIVITEIINDEKMIALSIVDFNEKINSTAIEFEFTPPGSSKNAFRMVPTISLIPQRTNEITYQHVPDDIVMNCLSFNDKHYSCAPLFGTNTEWYVKDMNNSWHISTIINIINKRANEPTVTIAVRGRSSSANEDIKLTSYNMSRFRNNNNPPLSLMLDGRMIVGS
jgi:hypothetical protein